MCGIAGIIVVNESITNSAAIKKMTDCISYRGPDGDGYWHSDDNRIALGHRRLSIIDLTHDADQPMQYQDRYVIVFNGEIYNYLELRKQLIQKGYTFHTSSDTEVLVALYDYKKEKCLDDLDGMFSFAIYDKQRSLLFAARDRFGEKPFFYHYLPGKIFAFGSEMKQLWSIGVSKDLNHKMVYNYLAKDLVMNPFNHSETFYRDVQRLGKSCYLEVNTNTLTLETKRYYDIDWRTTDHSITVEQAALKFKDLFYESVSRRLRSDVPVGSSLSGGLDSSMVVCTIDQMDSSKSMKRKTFSARFPGFHKDESVYQNLVIQQCQVDPHYIYPDTKSITNNLAKILVHQEEPIGSTSICAQYEVFAKARKENVIVLLDGQGADEILAGYTMYLPTFFSELKNANPGEYTRQWKAYCTIQSDNPINGMYTWPTVKDKLQGLIPKPVKEGIKSIQRMIHADTSFLNASFRNAYKGDQFMDSWSFSSLNEHLYFSTMQYGLEELLRYADRNSMAHSVEVRLPFLYHKLVEFLFSLPSVYKINNGWMKFIQREAYQHIVPEKILSRKDKIGYEPPSKFTAPVMNVNEYRQNLSPYINIERPHNEQEQWRLYNLINICSK